MSALWRCGVCEGVTDGGRTCSVCGAVVPWREVVAASVREEFREELERTEPPMPGEAPVRRVLRRAFERVLAHRDDGPTPPT